MLRLMLFSLVVSIPVSIGVVYFLRLAVAESPPALYDTARRTNEPDQPPADLSERLRRRKEDRDNKIRQAQMEVHPHANKFLRELEGYEMAADFCLARWEHYFHNNPTAALYGMSLPQPEYLNPGQYLKQVKLAKEDFLRSLEQCRVKLEQIEYEYYRDLAALQRGTAASGTRPPAPKTAVDDEVRLASHLAPRTGEIVEAISKEYHRGFKTAGQTLGNKVRVLHRFVQEASTETDASRTPTTSTLGVNHDPRRN